MTSTSRIWPEICKIQDTQTRIALSTCQNPEILERLSIAFPQCFGEMEDTSLVPLSSMQQLSAEQYRAEGATATEDTDERAELDWKGACQRCSIPMIGSWSEGDYIPSELRDQLTEESELGDIVLWQGREGLLVDLGFTGDDLVFVGLALASRIDRNA